LGATQTYFLSVSLFHGLGSTLPLLTSSCTGLLLQPYIHRSNHKRDQMLGYQTLFETRLDWQETSIVMFTPTQRWCLPSLLAPLRNVSQRRCREKVHEVRKDGVPTRLQFQAMRQLWLGRFVHLVLRADIASLLELQLIQGFRARSVKETTGRTTNTCARTDHHCLRVRMGKFYVDILALGLWSIKKCSWVFLTHLMVILSSSPTGMGGPPALSDSDRRR
jgi:hypothetical protein